jgi:FkbM family methyltransferase
MRKLLQRPFRLPLSMVLQLAAKARPIHVSTRTFWGCPITVVFPDPVSVHIWRYGFFERDATAAMLQFVKQGMTVLDVGAHVGYFSLLAGQLVGRQGTVHAFEPTPSTLSVLKTNVRRWPQVHPSRLALWSEAGTGVLHDFGPGLSPFNSFFSPRLTGSPRAPTEHRVRRETLDHYVSASQLTPDFIKIDAESAESHILVGSFAVIRLFRPVLCIEVGDLGVEGVPSSRELLDSVLELGYEVFETGLSGIRHHEPRERYGYENLLFLPKHGRKRNVASSRDVT